MDSGARQANEEMDQKSVGWLLDSIGEKLKKIIALLEILVERENQPDIKTDDYWRPRYKKR